MGSRRRLIRAVHFWPRDSFDVAFRDGELIKRKTSCYTCHMYVYRPLSNGKNRMTHVTPCNHDAVQVFCPQPIRLPHYRRANFTEHVAIGMSIRHTSRLVASVSILQT